jgi:hypothetical protein
MINTCKCSYINNPPVCHRGQAHNPPTISAGLNLGLQLLHARSNWIFHCSSLNNHNMSFYCEWAQRSEGKVTFPHSFFFFFFFQGLGFELRASHLQSKCSTLESHLQFIVQVIFLEIQPRLALNHDPLDLSLPSS